MNVIDKTSGKSLNFKAPNGLTETQEVLFPSVDKQDPDFATEIDVTICQMTTFLTVNVADDAMISAKVDEEVTPNAEIVLVLVGGDALQTITLGGALIGSDVLVPASSTVVVLMKYDGSNFITITSTNDNVQDGSITKEKIADDAVTTDKIEDKAVTLAKIADGTSGDILYFDTEWKSLAKGTDGQVLALVSGKPAWTTLS